MKLHALCLSILLIAGCGPERALSEADEQIVEDAAPIAVGGWSTGATEGGIVLTLANGGDVPMMTMRCAGNPAEFVVRIIGFTPIGSEERLSLGLGQEIVTMVANPADRSSGVVATTHDPAAAAAPLRTANAIVASYGAQNFGPVAPPEADAVEALIASCS